MFGVFFLALGIDENIIDKDHNEFIELRHEHEVHEVHEVGWGICESKRHYQELVKTITSGKSGFGNVTRSNLDLVVARTKVDFREDFGTSQLIKKNIDSGKRVFVFDGDCIERAVIYAHLKLPSFFLKKRAGQPQEEELGRM
jgi:hypothetical protein